MRGGVDKPFPILYTIVMFRNKSKMTVTTDEFGKQNMFAKEPQMYISQSDAERYALQTHAERAEKLNGKFAMLGFVAAIISYATTGHLFFGVI